MQTAEECQWFQDQIRGKKSLLEIGSYDGGSLIAWAMALERGARIRSIDVNLHETAGELTGVINMLKTLGFDALNLISDSTDQVAIDWAKQWAPYDVIFIDGNHLYDSVKADWLNYKDMGKLIAFHDIAGKEGGPGKLWEEIKSQELNSNNGIGILRNGNM